MKLPIFLLSTLSLPLSEGCWPQKWVDMSDVPDLSEVSQKLPPVSFSGEIKKFNKTHAFPSSLAINWMNLIEGDDVRDGTAWTWTGGFSRLNAPHFSLDMEVDEDTFAKNITTSQIIIDRLTESLKNDPQIAKQIKSVKFAMGQIFGVYNNDQQSTSSVILNDGFLRLHSKGPNNETARADMYAVFYKQGTLDAFDACKWISKLPQGFSCGRGATADESCGRWERFIPVKCSTIVVKVASRFCSRDEKNLDDPRPDCHSHVNWT